MLRSGDAVRSEPKRGENRGGRSAVYIVHDEMFVPSLGRGRGGGRCQHCLSYFSPSPCPSPGEGTTVTEIIPEGGDGCRGNCPRERDGGSGIYP
jgi:hypothetical protein